ncbi:MAG: hypothetical protein ACLPYY_21440 [Acidimicrobiales bacterium]
MTPEAEDGPLTGPTGPDEGDLRDPMAWPPDDVGRDTWLGRDTCQGMIRDDELDES